ncbi:MAG TPA: hypothetical protein VKA67_13915 [Verrucomicrobiae bacterium]|nr:hypothetical protein [Verrucomicrobiae bacterium]
MLADRQVANRNLLAAICVRHFFWHSEERVRWEKAWDGGKPYTAKPSS